MAKGAATIPDWGSAISYFAERVPKECQWHVYLLVQLTSDHEYLKRQVLPRLLASSTQSLLPCRVRCSQIHGPGTILVGDAAHAVTPIGGQGCNAALEDGLVLDQVLTESGSSSNFLGLLKNWYIPPWGLPYVTLSAIVSWKPPWLPVSY